jgi:hypothetical protein
VATNFAPPVCAGRPYGGITLAVSAKWKRLRARSDSA